MVPGACRVSRVIIWYGLVKFVLACWRLPGRVCTIQSLTVRAGVRPSGRAWACFEAVIQAHSSV
jgi:hypothetical protein